MAAPAEAMVVPQGELPPQHFREMYSRVLARWNALPVLEHAGDSLTRALSVCDFADRSIASPLPAHESPRSSTERELQILSGGFIRAIGADVIDEHLTLEGADVSASVAEAAIDVSGSTELMQPPRGTFYNHPISECTTTGEALKYFNRFFANYSGRQRRQMLLAMMNDAARIVYGDSKNDIERNALATAKLDELLVVLESPYSDQEIATQGFKVALGRLPVSTVVSNPLDQTIPTGNSSRRTGAPRERSIMRTLRREVTHAVDIHDLRKQLPPAARQLRPSI